MISKQEIISSATGLKLLPTTVEKDYVISWVLYGISIHPQLTKWLFKGGTCLKKCYFDTYRFSEDLDFTVPVGSIYGKDEIKAALNEVANIVYEQIGLNLRTREIEVEESVNKRNRKTYVAKFTYLGPLNLPSRTQQRIKFDITDDEIIIDSPDAREVFHPYSDSPNLPTKINCYSVNEILAEKTRAIYERQGRARDIYDIVNISRSFREHVDVKKARHGVKEKFKFKSLSEPSVDFIFSEIDFPQLKSNWEDQLKHQLQILPSAESFYNDLRSALSWWIDENPTETNPSSISNSTEEKIIPRVRFSQPINFQANKIIGRKQDNIIDRIRYASRNRLCVEIHYHNATRLVEPYSLRQPRTGNLLLYVYELRKEQNRTEIIKAYKIDEITNAEITQQAFSPRYIVEL